MSMLVISLAALALAHALPTTVPSTCSFSKPQPLDRALASTRTHSGRVAGSTAAGIAGAINSHLMKEMDLAPCSSFTQDELQQLLEHLWCSTSPEINELFVAAKDSRALAQTDLAKHQAQWRALRALTAHDQTAAEALRDAKCADVLRVWSHHVPAHKQASLKHILRLPELPVYKEAHGKHAVIGAAYSESFNCVTGHNMTSTDMSDHKLPHWPKEVHYTGMGHGAYPFWLGGGGSSGPGAPIEVWWSEPLAAEKFYHSSCSMSEAGYSSDVPCYHLMLGTQPNPKAYLYTHNQDFCCIASPDGTGPQTEKLTPIASNFMDKMTLNASYGNLSGTYYSGPVKQYLMTEPFSEPVTYFWYLTTMDDLPVQQGEGGFGGRGIEIYHEYNTSSWGPPAQAYTADMFAVPQICKTTSNKCGFP